MTIAQGPITASEIEALLRDLTPIGLGSDGATNRLAWTPEEEQARAWFQSRAADVGHCVERDAAGNLWARPGADPPWWAVGSHLDTVIDGGAYDGALGVAAGFAVAAREQVAVIAFADEEGARFNTPTFGSRALTGRLDPELVLSRVDADGERLSDAMRASGVDPSALATATAGIGRLRGFLELHIDQTRELATRAAPLGVASHLAARMRTQVVVDGRADHAGTTRGEERHDALAAATRLIVRAGELSTGGSEMVFGATRVTVEPNAPSTVPARVRVWLDARSPDPSRVQEWRAQLDEAARSIAAEERVAITLDTAAWAPGTTFPREVTGVLAAAAAEAAGITGVPEVVCWAGHDSGVLAESVPAGLLLVRNADGVSHSPLEHVSLEDAAIGANALLGAVRSLY